MSTRTLPDLDVVRIRRSCERWSALDSDVSIDCAIEPDRVTIVQTLPPLQPAPPEETARVPVARLAYSFADRQWSLYRCDEQMRFRRQASLGPCPYVQPLLDWLDDYLSFWP